MTAFYLFLMFIAVAMIVTTCVICSGRETKRHMEKLKAEMKKPRQKFRIPKRLLASELQRRSTLFLLNQKRT